MAAEEPELFYFGNPDCYLWVGFFVVADKHPFLTGFSIDPFGQQLVVYQDHVEREVFNIAPVLGRYHAGKDNIGSTQRRLHTVAVYFKVAPGGTNRVDPGR